MRSAGKLFALLLLAFPALALAGPGGFWIASPDFAQNALMPARLTCDGENRSPRLEIGGVPGGAKSLLLVVEDPDAPGGIFTHWLVWNIPAGTTKVAGGAAPAGAVQGTNDFGKAGYSGPCPPSGVHRYFFRLTALDIGVNLPAGASRNDVLNAIRGHVVGRAELIGKYER